MNLFDQENSKNRGVGLPGVPLAERLRPEKLRDFVGQGELVGKGKILRELIKSDKIPSLIFWGPPGTGKTTLARIIARATNSAFVSFSAVTSGVSELRQVLEGARARRAGGGQTIVFIDEIHRWNKAQQDALLPEVERGTIVLIGATTENPSFEINSALLSRAQVFVLESLDQKHILKILRRALADKKQGLGNYPIKINDKVLKFLAVQAGGDARVALNGLELAFHMAKPGPGKTVVMTEELAAQALRKTHRLYDKAGDWHYNIISALHKSLRGSDADAALYWLVRMLEAGEDPLYVARRLVRFASEDVGLANSQALNQAVAGYQAAAFIGLPECNVILAQVVVYLAKCKKSNELYTAYLAAQKDALATSDEPVPLHLKNAPTKLMRNLGFGKDYRYSPDFNYQETQDYFPEKLKNKKYLK